MSSTFQEGKSCEYQLGVALGTVLKHQAEQIDELKRHNEALKKELAQLKEFLKGIAEDVKGKSTTELIGNLTKIE